MIENMDMVTQRNEIVEEGSVQTVQMIVAYSRRSENMLFAYTTTHRFSALIFHTLLCSIHENVK